MKKCRKCGKSSYSASEHRTWLCPYCDSDLTKEKFMNANDLKTVRVEEEGNIITHGRQENNILRFLQDIVSLSRNI